MTPTIQLANGRYLDLVKPDPESFDAYAVAASLAKTCRFGGHTRLHYSVAQHCVLAARAFYGFEPDPFGLLLARNALHHEDDEVAVGDISGPLKLLIGDALKPIAERIKHAAWWRFDIAYGSILSADVKDVDNRLLVTEKRDVMPEHPTDSVEWLCQTEHTPYEERIVAWEWQYAVDAWLAHWAQLMPDGYALGGPFCSRVLPDDALDYSPVRYRDVWDKQRVVQLHDSLQDTTHVYEYLSYELFDNGAPLK